MNALIFGASGQDGHYLTTLLQQQGLEVIGVSRNNNGTTKGDVADFELVKGLVKSRQPEFIFHLAANSTTGHHAIFENHETISTGTINILESVKLFSPSSKVFITGSGVQFNNTGNPIKETDEFKANNAYAIARIQSVYAARYFRNLGLKVYVGYLFHHESPLRKDHHVAKMISEQVKKIASGEKVRITLGDKSVKKEWAFAGDIAQGIYHLVSQENIYEACIGTGEGYTIQDWLEVCFSLINKDWKEYLEENVSDYRAEYDVLVSNPATLNKLGWRHKTSLKELARMMISEK